MIFHPDGIIPDSGLTGLNIYIYIYIYLVQLNQSREYRLKFTSQSISPCDWMVRSLGWRLSQPGFDPRYGKILSSHTDEFW